MNEHPNRPQDDLTEIEWTTVLYLTDELDEAQRQSFELLLEHDALAQQVLVRLSRLWSMVGSSGHFQPNTLHETIEPYLVGKMNSGEDLAVRGSGLNGRSSLAKWLVVSLCGVIVLGTCWWWPRNSNVEDRILAEAQDLAEAWSSQIDNDPSSDLALVEFAESEGDWSGDADWLLAALMSLDEGQTDELLQ